MMTYDVEIVRSFLVRSFESTSQNQYDDVYYQRICVEKDVLSNDNVSFLDTGTRY